MALTIKGKVDCYYPMVLNRNIWNSGDFLECLLVLPCPVIKVNVKLKQTKTGRTDNSPDTSGMKFGSKYQSRNSDQLMCLLRAKGIFNG